jgi:ATP-dependent Clp protease ATP-binding subunit ClpA
VLQAAEQQANRAASRDITPDHLLLGLLDQPTTFGAQLLRSSGVDPDLVRRKVATPGKAI